jgi:hypothetical protein
MIENVWHRSIARPLAIALAAALMCPAAAAAQTVTGQARAVQVTAIGTTVLADTGTLGGTADARDATLLTGLVPSLLTGEVLHAVTIGWPDQVASEASLANLNLAIGAIGITADVVMASALAALNAPVNARSFVDNLFVNGIYVNVTGAPNQRVVIPGGQVIINEQISSPSGMTVNALHATVLGIADVVIASATAGIR